MPAAIPFRFSDEDRSRLTQARLDADTIAHLERLVQGRHGLGRRRTTPAEREKLLREIWQGAQRLRRALARLEREDRDSFDPLALTTLLDGLARFEDRVFRELPEYWVRFAEEFHRSSGRADAPPRPTHKRGRPFEWDRFSFALSVAGLLDRRGYRPKRSATGVLARTVDVALPAAKFVAPADMRNLMIPVIEAIDARYSDEPIGPLAEGDELKNVTPRAPARARARRTENRARRTKNR